MKKSEIKSDQNKTEMTEKEGSEKLSYTNGGFTKDNSFVELHIVEKLPEQKTKDDKK